MLSGNQSSALSLGVQPPAICYEPLMTFSGLNIPSSRAQPFVFSQKGNSTTSSDLMLHLYGGSGLSCTHDSRAVLGDHWVYDVASASWALLHSGAGVQVEIIASPDFDSANTPGCRHAGGSVTFPTVLDGVGGGRWSGIVYGGERKNKRYNSGWEFGFAESAWRQLVPDLPSGSYLSGNISLPGVFHEGARAPRAMQISFSSRRIVSPRILIFGGRDYNWDLGRSEATNLFHEWDLERNLFRYLSGSNTANSPSVFGEKNEYSPLFVPASRCTAASWASNDRFWLFGGFQDAESDWTFNDLWCYDFRKGEFGQWALLSGSPDRPNLRARVETLGTYHPENTPPALGSFPTSSFALGDKLFLFGGASVSYDTPVDSLLWAFSLLEGMWKVVDWCGAVSETVTINQNCLNDLGEYNASKRMYPPARAQHASWVLRTETEFTMFLGFGCRKTNQYRYNDLWEFHFRDEDCLSHGWTSSTGRCVCFENYHGPLCNDFQCGSIWNNETGSVCTGRGSCVDYNICECLKGYDSDSFCDKLCCDRCGDVPFDGELVCNSHGSCDSVDLCTCRDRFYGPFCAEFIPGTGAIESDMVRIDHEMPIDLIPDDGMSEAFACNVIFPERVNPWSKTQLNPYLGVNFVILELNPPKLPQNSSQTNFNHVKNLIACRRYNHSKRWPKYFK